VNIKASHSKEGIGTLRSNAASFIRKRRLQLGLSQKLFAERCGVSQPAVCRWETELSNMSFDTVSKIAANLESEAVLLFVPKEVVDENKNIFNLIECMVENPDLPVVTAMTKGQCGDPFAEGHFGECKVTRSVSGEQAIYMYDNSNPALMQDTLDAVSDEEYSDIYTASLDELASRYNKLPWKDCIYVEVFCNETTDI